MRLTGVWLVLVVVWGAGCGGGDKQSFAEGMKVICSAPDGAGIDKVAPAMRQQVMSEWITKRLKNKRARNVMTTIADYAPPARRKLLLDSAKEAGIGTCELADLSSRVDPQIARALAEVPGTHFKEIPVDAPKLVVTKRAIALNGKELVTLVNGDVAPAERDKNSEWKVPLLVAAFAKASGLANGAKAAGATPLIVYFDRDTPYRLVIRVVFSALPSNGGFKDIRFVVRSGEKLHALAVFLPQLPRPGAATGGAGAPGLPDLPAKMPSKPPLGMALAFTREHLMAWSMSGEAGTLAKPALRLPLRADARVGEPSFDEPQLTKLLTDIVGRQWKGKKRTGSDKQLIVIGAKETPFHALARTMAIAIGAADAPPLFPEILLSPGFN